MPLAVDFPQVQLVMLLLLIMVCTFNLDSSVEALSAAVSAVIGVLVTVSGIFVTVVGITVTVCVLRTKKLNRQYAVESTVKT